MSKFLKNISVLGSGSWGTALAILLAKNGIETLIWGFEKDHVAAIKKDGNNQLFLPGIPFPEKLSVTDDLDEAIKFSQDILVVVPSHAFRQTLKNAAASFSDQHRIIWATKGLDQTKSELLHEVCRQELNTNIPTAVFSGPTFAGEVATGLPTAVTIASQDQNFAADMSDAFTNETFRAYTTEDLISVQLGGAVKNVLAIAAGISDGLGFGANSRSALITRGLAEMCRLGLALGGKQETFMGLAGLGDLVLTCTDDQSRNRRFGKLLAKGLDFQEAMDEIGQVVEGYGTTKTVYNLAQNTGVEMPITEQVHQILYQNKSAMDAVKALFARELKPENT
jgi:glycerol-3-phosphate dehydrogenase (NAD(P)+)